MRRPSAQRRRRGGFTLIEVLIVIAIIGILVTAGLATYLHARTVAVERAAQSYAQNVYKVAFAYVASAQSHAVVEEDCTHGYAAGGYSVGDGAPVISCAVQDVGGTPRVTVLSSTGLNIVLPQ